jgi:hypothetical protein
MVSKHKKATFLDQRPVVARETVRLPHSKTAAARPQSTFAELPAGRGASHPEYPLERVCSFLSEPFQLTFARNAQQHFLTREDVEVTASHRGLTIRGETEDAVDAAFVLLRDLYGPRIHISPSTVLYHHGVTLEQPWMGLRVRCATGQFDVVHSDLLDRDARIASFEVEGADSHIQATAPLASLLGYRAALEKLTGGSAKHAIWLSHYAPMGNLPPEGHAA